MMPSDLKVGQSGNAFRVLFVMDMDKQSPIPFKTYSISLIFKIDS